MLCNLSRFSVFLVAGVGVTTALNIPRAIDLNPLSGTGLSNQCQNTLLGFTKDSSASTCLNIAGLAGVLTLAPNSSVVPPLNTWLEGLCRADPCSNDTINAVTTNITNGCQSDFASAGASSNSIQPFLQSIPQLYPTIRKIACLKTTSNDTLCLSSLLLDVQGFVGTNLTASSALHTISQLQGAAKNSSLPASLVCTGCVQAAFEILQQDQPTLVSNSSTQGGTLSQCGSNFLSSPTPSTVVEGTGASAPSGTLPAKQNAGSSSSNSNGASSFGPMLGFMSSSLLAFTAGTFVLV